MEIIKYKDCVTSVSTCHACGVDKMMKKIIIITGGRTRKSFKKSGKKKSYRKYKKW